MVRWYVEISRGYVEISRGGMLKSAGGMLKSAAYRYYKETINKETIRKQKD